MKFSLLILVFVVIMVCSGCSMYNGKSKKVILRHPVTQEFVSCQVDRWETAASFAKNEECIQNYKEKGFVVWGER